MFARFMRKRKVKASISLFMAIIMLSMFVISSVINDATRMRAARAMVQSAADSAALSVLAKYDGDLKDRYGLFALYEDNKDAVLEDFTDYFTENLSSNYPLSSDFKESLKSFMKSVGQDMDGKRVAPYDIYGFELIDAKDREDGITDASVDLAYSIIEPGVLETQMAEFAKYRGFISMSNIIDLSDLSEQAEKSGKILDKMEESVAGNGSGDGSGYKQDVEKASNAFYLLTQKLKTLNTYTGAFGSVDLLLLSDRVEKMSDRLKEIENDANNYVIPQLNEYKRLLGVADSKRSAMNAAQSAYNSAVTAKQNAQSALDDANSLNDRIKALDNLYISIDAFMNSEFTKGSEWQDEKDYYSSLPRTIVSQYSMKFYAEYREGNGKNNALIEAPQKDEDRQKITDLFDTAIQNIENRKNSINAAAKNGNAAVSASNAQAAYNAAESDASNKQNAYNDATNAYNEAAEDLNAQREKLQNEVKPHWKNTLNNAYNNSTGGMINRTDSTKKHIEEARRIISTEVFNFEVGERYPWSIPERFNAPGINGAADEIASDYATAKSYLAQAKNTTQAYINTMQQRIDDYGDISDDDPKADEKRMDEALKSDAETAMKELDNIQRMLDHPANGKLTVEDYLAKARAYGSDVNTGVAKIETKYNSIVSAAEGDDPYTYLYNQVREVVNYDQRGTADLLSTYRNDLVNKKDVYKSNVYGRYYEYKPYRPKNPKKNTDYDESTGSNLFSLFEDFDLGDFRDDGNSSDHASELTYGGSIRNVEDEKPDELPSHLYKKSDYRTSDKYKAADDRYTTRVLKELAGGGGSSDMSQAGLDEEKLNEDISGLENLEMDENADNQKDGFDLLETLMESIGGATNKMTNGLMVDFYTMSMFKNRLEEKSPDDWKEFYNENYTGGLSALSKKGFYAKRADPKEGVKKNLYFREKDKDTFYRSEIEYILHGDLNQGDNEKNIYLKIYALRMVNNLIAMYQNNEIRDLASYAASFAGPFAPLVQIAIIAVLAALETYLDMEFLIKYGYKIAFWKKPENITLSIENIESNLSSGTSTNFIKSLLSEPNIKNCSFLVSYETYLWFFMLIRSREDKVEYSADLMQMNIRLKKPGYIMANHFTYVRCHTYAAIKPAFLSMGYMPPEFKHYYADKGTGENRLVVESLNYQGY